MQQNSSVDFLKILRDFIFFRVDFVQKIAQKKSLNLISIFLFIFIFTLFGIFSISIDHMSLGSVDSANLIQKLLATIFFDLSMLFSFYLTHIVAKVFFKGKSNFMTYFRVSNFAIASIVLLAIVPIFLFGILELLITIIVQDPSVHASEYLFHIRLLIALAVMVYTFRNFFVALKEAHKMDTSSTIFAMIVSTVAYALANKTFAWITA